MLEREGEESAVAGEFQLLANVIDVRFDRVDAQAQLIGDLAAGQPVDHMLQPVPLAS